MFKEIFSQLWYFTTVFLTASNYSIKSDMSNSLDTPFSRVSRTILHRTFYFPEKICYHVVRQYELHSPSFSFCYVLMRSTAALNYFFESYPYFDYYFRYFLLLLFYHEIM